MNYILILVVAFLLILVSNLFGNKIAKKLNLNNKMQYTALGLATILAIFFFLFIILIFLKLSAPTINFMFMMVLLIISVYSLYDIHKVFSYKPMDLLLLALYLVVMVYLSTKITIGEQMSDSNFYFTLVQRNIDSSVIGNFNGYNGGITQFTSIPTSYLYQAFYQLFSSILWGLRVLFANLVINNGIYMWGSNILFYFMTMEAILNAYKLFKSKIGLLVNILFVGLYLGSIYYNLSLPHIGVIFFTSLLTNELLIISQEVKMNGYNGGIVVALFSAALISCASTGLMVSFFISYAYIMMLFYYKDSDVFKIIWIMAFPIMIYSILYMHNMSFTIFCLFIEAILILLHLITHNFENVNKRLMVIIRKLIYVIPILLIAYSVYLTELKAYFSYIIQFFYDQSTFDRVQAYFSYSTFLLVLENSFYYVCLLSILVNKKTRDIAIFLIILIVTFLNPLVMPFVVKLIGKLYIIQRIFYVLFSNGFMILGMYALIDIINRLKWQKIIILGVMVTSLSYLFVDEISKPFHQIYIPSEDFNLLYKLDQNQVDVVRALSYIIEEEDIAYPRVVSQIYGTILVEPKITLINGVLERRFYEKAYSNNETLRELTEIFYSPVFDGDDGDRFNAKYREMDELLEAGFIDFIIVDKSLHVTNDEGAWVPLHYYVQECAQIIYENEDYFLFRYNR